MGDCSLLSSYIRQEKTIPRPGVSSVGSSDIRELNADELRQKVSAMGEAAIRRIQPFTGRTDITIPMSCGFSDGGPFPLSCAAARRSP